MLPRELKVGSFVLKPRGPGGSGGRGRPRGEQQPCALPLSPWPRQGPGSRRGSQPPPSGTVRRGPSVPSPGAAGCVGRPSAVAARRATSPPGAQSSLRAPHRALGPHPARPQARLPPPSHSHPDSPEPGSGGVPGTLTGGLGLPLGTDEASRCPSPAPRGGGASARASPRGGEG